MVTFSLGEAADDETCWDVIMWMDHRASKETDFINSLGHPGKSVRLSVCPCSCPTVRPYIHLFAHPSTCWSVSPSICLSVSPSICLSICPSVSPSICPSVSPSIRPSVSPSICSFIYTSDRLSIRLLQQAGTRAVNSVRLSIHSPVRPSQPILLTSARNK